MRINKRQINRWIFDEMQKKMPGLPFDYEFICNRNYIGVHFKDGYMVDHIITPELKGNEGCLKIIAMGIGQSAVAHWRRYIEDHIGMMSVKKIRNIIGKGEKK